MAGFIDAVLVHVVILDSCVTTTRVNTRSFCHLLLPIVLCPQAIGTGSSVFTVQASDADIGSNARVLYSLSGVSCKSHFSINATSGVVSTAARLDYESSRQHLCTVIATDQGMPVALATNVTLTVDVTNVDDHAPHFLLSPYSANVDENSPTGTFIVNVTAIDDDPFSTLTYSVIAGNDNQIFAIAPRSGVVTLQGSIDRESLAVYTLTIQAVSSSNSSLAASNRTSTQLVVMVKDINDFPPIFSQLQYVVAVAENTQPGSDVGFVSANDTNDIGRNAMVSSYQFVSGNATGVFSLTSTGTIVLNKTLDRETDGSYSGVIRAFDAGVPSLSADAHITIIVSDVNDNSPLFEMALYNATLREDVGIGTPVVSVKATDRDIGTNAMVSYRIANVLVPFTVNARTGQLIVSSNLNYSLTQTYQFNVVATDSGMPSSRSSTVNVVVDILPKPNGAPVFLGTPYIANVSEFSRPNIVVFTVRARSGDPLLVGPVSYSLVSPSNGQWSVNSVSGDLRLVSSLDFETAQRVPVTIAAQVNDSKNTALSSTVIVFVNVLDENDHPPRFSPAQLVLDISESSVSPMFLGQLSVSDVDVIHSAVTYRLESSTSPGKLSVNSTGAVLLIVSIDREVQATVTLNVSVTDGLFTSYGTVMVNVLDDNDNSPIFTKALYEASVQERSPVGAAVITVNATDADIGTNAVLSYSIVGGNVNSTFAIGSADGLITVFGTVDYEYLSRFRLVVSVRDSGPGHLNSTAIVLINVTDIDDEPPVFIPASYQLDVAENSTVGSTLLLVQATDRDGGLSARIRYSITSGNVNSTFSIDSATGLIRLAESLDFEKIPMYTIGLVANNSGVTGSRSVALLMVTVLDVNDNAPVFKPNLYTEHVPENAVINFPIRQVTAIDADTGLGGQIGGYAIVSGNSGGVFNISAKTGLLAVAQSLDYDTHPLGYTLLVRAIDRGDPQLSGEATVIVLLDDFNDNSPIFSRALFSASVREDAAINSTVTTVNATDRDSGTNAEIRYSLLGQAPFSIDNQSGVVVVSGLLDRENQSSYTITVVAQDRGAPQLQQTTTLSITILDANDVSPMFVMNPYYGRVAENSAGGVSVLQVAALDSDLGANAVVQYHLNTSLPFSINTMTGVVSVNGSLDREAIPLYEFFVRAVDGGNPSLSSEVLVNITIEDRNDNPPVFNQSRYSANILENATLASVVYTFDAADADIGDNAVVTYSIVSGNALGRFNIAPGSSHVTLAGFLDREIIPSFRLDIRAVDGGTPQMTATTQLLVTVLDVNDESPLFDSASYTYTISEDRPVGSFIGTVRATDQDIGTNAAITYSLVSNTALPIAVNSSSGVLTVSQPGLDRETLAVLSFDILARDGGSPSRTSTTRVTISLTDINDNSPVFSPQQFATQILENATAGTILLHVLAKDSDSGLNGAVSYAITSGDDSGHFTVGTQDGAIELLGSLDRETTAGYELVITASDNGKPRRNASAVVNITVLDVNDNRPQLAPSALQITFTENAGPLSVLSGLSASDADTFPLYNLSVDLMLLGGLSAPRSDALLINSSTLLQSLSIAGRGTHSITVSGAGSIALYNTIMQSIQFNSSADEPIATNRLLSVSISDGTFISTTSQVTVLVAYINDHAPQLRAGNRTANFSANFTEDGTAITIFSQASVLTDADGGNNVISYVNATILNAANGASEVLDFGILLVGNLRIQRHTMGPNQILQLLGPALITEFQTALRLLTYINTAEEITGMLWREIQIVAFDGKFASNEAYVNVSIERTADSPILQLGDFVNHVVIYNESMPGVALAGQNASITDSDSSTLHQLTVRVINYRSSSDSLTVNTVGTSISSNNQAGVLSLSGSDTLDNYLAVLRTVRFIYTLNIGETFESLQQNGTIRHVQFVCSDGQSNSSVATTTITFSATNNAPSIRVAGQNAFSTAFMENDPPLRICADSLVLFDPDSVSLVKAGVVFAPLPVDEGEGLNVPGTLPPGISVQHLDDRGGLQLSGVASLAAYQLALNSIVYVNPGENITAGRRNVIISVDDGQLPSNLFSVRITVTPVDDPPVIQLGSNGDVVYVENGPAVLIASSSKISDPDSLFLTDIRVSITNRLDESREQITCCHGNLIQGITRIILQDTFIFRFSSGPASLTIFNTVLSGLQYNNTAAEPLANQSRQIVISARDATSSSTAVTVNVTVSLVNDNPPVFAPAQRFVSVAENVSAGYIVVQVAASDADADSMLSYSLVRNFSLFDINKQSGTIRTASGLDFDVLPNSYSLEVVAFDGVHTSTQFVNVSLTDVNDNSPVFNVSSANISVNESAPEGTVVYIAKAYDNDSTSNGDVQYMLRSTPGATLFSVGRISGELSIKQTLDYETQRNFTLEITAFDLGAPSRTSVITVSVIVVDENDNAPIFVPSIVTLVLPEDTAPASVVTDINATDVDSPSITYSISSSVFSIDSASGIVQLRSPLDFEQLSHYNITVIASDTGRRPVLSSTARLIVTVTDINDHAPAFLQSSYAANVSESVIPTRSVAIVNASDQDSGENGRLQYSIISGNDNNRFSVSMLGEVFVIAGLDFENQSVYNLVILAQDFGLPALNSSTRLRIQVLDANDHAPQFTESTQFINVSEATSIPSNILQLSASDRDQGTNAEIYYRIVSGNNDTHFSINASSGVLVLSSPLDREQVDQYALVISATDGAESPMMSRSTVLITVLDVNDNAPVFGQTAPGQLEENEPSGTPVASLAATDRDIGSNGQISYSLFGGSGLFSVNATTGEVLTNSPLNYDGQPHMYNLTVVASDHGSPPLSTNATLIVDILDVNDNSPQLAESQFYIDFVENSVTPELVVLNASDADSGVNAMLVYSITSGDPANNFAISSTGVLSVNRSLNRESVSSYSLTVCGI